MTCFCRILSAYKLPKSLMMHPMQGLESLQKGDKQIKTQALSITIHCRFSSLFFILLGCLLVYIIQVYHYLHSSCASSLPSYFFPLDRNKEYAPQGTSGLNHLFLTFCFFYIKIGTQAAEVVFTCILAVRPQQIANNNCKLLFSLSCCFLSFRSERLCQFTHLLVNSIDRENKKRR